MKQLGNKSLSSVLATAVHLLWYFEWIAGGICIIMGITAAYIRKKYAFNLPISYSPLTIRQVYSLKKNGPVSIINSNNGILSFGIDANFQNIVMLLIGYGALFAAILIITYQLKKILQSFKQNRPFQQMNILRIRIIAIVLISYSLIQWLFVIIAAKILISTFLFVHIDLTYNFNYNCLLMGIVLLVVQEIFKTGMLLEEDKQLTI